MCAGYLKGEVKTSHTLGIWQKIYKWQPCVLFPLLNTSNFPFPPFFSPVILEKQIRWRKLQAFCNYRNVPLRQVSVCQVCWKKQPRTKVHQGLLINYYRKENQQNPHSLCFLFPSTFTVLQSLETGQTHFSKQKYIYVHSLPQPQQSREMSTLHVGCCGCIRNIPDFLCRHVWSTQPHQATWSPCSTLLPHHRFQPTSHGPEGARSSNVDFLFSFPRTNRVTEATHPAPDSAKHWRYQDCLALSASKVHWHQRVYSQLKGVLVSQEISRCCSSPLCPLIRTLQSQVPMSTETMPKHPMFSLPDR